jgi:hypothetical protein
MSELIDMERSKRQIAAQKYFAGFFTLCKTKINETFERIIVKEINDRLADLENCERHSFSNYENSDFEYCKICGFTQLIGNINR